MASKLNAIWNFLSHYKYLIVVVIGIAIVGFLDENSFMHRMKYEMQISDLKAEIKKYQLRHEADSIQLRELRHNSKLLCDFAALIGAHFFSIQEQTAFIRQDSSYGS